MYVSALCSSVQYRETFIFHFPTHGTLEHELPMIYFVNFLTMLYCRDNYRQAKLCTQDYIAIPLYKRPMFQSRAKANF